MANGSVVRGRGLALTVAVVVGATAVLYIALIVAQSERQVATVTLVVLLFLAALACVVGTVRFEDAGARGVVGSAGVGLLLSMGYLAIFSVGLPLLVAGVLMVAWLLRTRDQRQGPGWLPLIPAFIIGAILPWTVVLLP